MLFESQRNTLAGRRLARWSFVVVLITGLRSASGQEQGPADAEDFFERQVRPVLVERCFECHAADTQENGLRLDSRAAMLRGGQRGPAIVAGKPAQSLLVEAVQQRGELKMPPSGPLKPQQIAAIEQWLRDGAVWPDAPTTPPRVTRQHREQQLQAQRKQHWAFRPIKKPPMPEADASWVKQPIDHFILAQLKAQSLTPAAAADPRTLIRRLYYDVIGLPPSAQDIATFIADPSPQAYDTLVDQLLNRPEYGEHWARHWLDIARYADTTGYQEGGERRYAFAWTYRDYVVRSLNEDTPFDQFVVEQLAADRLQLAPEQQWKLAGMGFLTLGPRFNYVRHEIIDDRIDVVTRGLLGLTVTCARCHDHKYDPVLADDYYGLYGIFASSQEPLYTDLPRTGRSGGEFARYRRFRTEAARATGRFEQFHARVHREMQHEMRALVGDYLRYLVQQMDEHRTVNQPSFDTERGHIRGPTPYGPGAIVYWQHFIATRGEQDPVFGVWNQLSKLSREQLAADAHAIIQKDESLNPALRHALLEAAPRSMLDVATVYGNVLEQCYDEWTQLLAANPHATQLDDPAREQLRQVLYADDSPVAVNIDEAHDYYTDGEFNEYMGLKREVDSLFVEYLDVAAPRGMVLTDRETAEEPRVFQRGVATRPGEQVPRQFLRVFSDLGAEEIASGSGRLEIARAIVDKKNPLTARVIVNRVWQWHFGRGLVETSSDFGTRATPPSHPELLDWLAADFMEHGWSMKRLHKQILLSATWQQSSQATQSALELDPDNRLLSHMQRRRLSFEALRDSLLLVSGRLRLEQGGPPDEELDSPRRSLYLLVNRDDLPSVRATFDFPSPDISISKRSETTVPQQALFLMNSEFSMNIAGQLVDQMHEQIKSPTASSGAEWLYGKVLGRLPSYREVALAIELLELPATANATTAANKERWRDFAHVLLMSNEFMFVD